MLLPRPETIGLRKVRLTLILAMARANPHCSLGNLAKVIGSDVIETLHLPVHVNVFVVGLDGSGALGACCGLSEAARSPRACLDAFCRREPHQPAFAGLAGAP